MPAPMSLDEYAEILLPSHDIAVLQLQGASGLPTAKLGDSSKLSVGDAVVAGQAVGAIHFPEEPWREPLLATCSESGNVHGVRTHARTLMGDALFMLDIPWKEPAF